MSHAGPFSSPSNSWLYLKPAEVRILRGPRPFRSRKAQNGSSPSAQRILPLSDAPLRSLQHRSQVKRSMYRQSQSSQQYRRDVWYRSSPLERINRRGWTDERRTFDNRNQETTGNRIQFGQRRNNEREYQRRPIRSFNPRATSGRRFANFNQPIRFNNSRNRLDDPAMPNDRRFASVNTHNEPVFVDSKLDMGLDDIIAQNRNRDRYRRRPFKANRQFERRFQPHRKGPSGWMRRLDRSASNARYFQRTYRPGDGRRNFQRNRLPMVQRNVRNPNLRNPQGDLDFEYTRFRRRYDIRPNPNDRFAARTALLRARQRFIMQQRRRAQEQSIRRGPWNPRDIGGPYNRRRRL
ncbi:hypothetical protein ACOME3_002130 [Neoechinorhynchus agilis]